MMQTIPVGPQLIRAVCIAYAADVSPILVGTHGVGKSEILVQVARALDIAWFKWLGRSTSTASS